MLVEMELKDKNAVSDDEEDLELLRLAALQSLRQKPEAAVEANPNPQQYYKQKHYNGAAKSFNKRGRGYHGNQGGRGRNNAYNRVRNTNLIAITPIDIDDKNDEIKIKKADSAPKLVLPQDRYCKTNDFGEKSTESNNDKFSRYNNSDDSESESESSEKLDISDEESTTKKMERTNSLEEIMKELESEIHGDSKPTEVKNKTKTPKIKKVKVKKEDPPKKEEVPTSTVTSNVEEDDILEKLDFEADEDIQDLEKEEIPEEKIQPKPKAKSRSRSRSPIIPREKSVPYQNFERNYNNVKHVPDKIFHQIPFHPTLPINTNPIYNPHVPYINVTNTYIPSHRPLSPLQINSDIYNTMTMAPLSPRSAAFVLQNKEIIERRKKSPRRSYSRSPSPRFRRSVSPRFREYSLSPKRSNRRSRSKTPTRRQKHSRSISPRQKSPLPRALQSRRTSPIDRRSPNNRSPKSPIRKRTPPRSIKDRLGMKISNSQSEKEESTVEEEPKSKKSRSMSKSPIRSKVEPEPADDSKLDPILEARKRKFESKEIKPEGIIRLKPKSSQEDIELEENKDIEELKENEEIDEDELLNEDDIIIDAKVDDLFSDEESDDETEGRFKTSTKESKPVPVLPFTKLLDPSVNNIKTKPLEKADNRRKRTDKFNRNKQKSNESRIHSRQRSRSPLRSKEESNVRILKQKSPKEDVKDKQVKSRLIFKTDSRKERVTSPIENKKIEIKIRNPSKYEGSSKYDVANEDVIIRAEGPSRKVEITKEKDLNDFGDPEIIIEEDDEDVSNKNDGDLRAQLKRKRAERQHKIPMIENMQTRILHNALEGAVFKKAKKAKRTKEHCEEIKDGKLPIHMRLGVSSSTDIYTEKKSRKKHKSKGSMEQAENEVHIISHVQKICIRKIEIYA